MTENDRGVPPPEYDTPRPAIAEASGRPCGAEPFFRRAVAAAVPPSARNGMFIVFRSAQTLWGIDVRRLKYITCTLKPTLAIGRSGFVREVISFCGTFVPVIDMRLRCGLETRKRAHKPCIIIVASSGYNGPMMVGIVADEADAITYIDRRQSAPPGSAAGNIPGKYLRGTSNVCDKRVMLLDVDALCRDDTVLATTSPLQWRDAFLRGRELAQQSEHAFWRTITGPIRRAVSHCRVLRHGRIGDDRQATASRPTV